MRIETLVLRVVGCFVGALLIGCQTDRSGEAKKSVPLPPGTEEVPAPPSKVILFSVPGFDADHFEQEVRDGYLPNMRRVRVEGTVARIGAASRTALWTGSAKGTLAAPKLVYSPTKSLVQIRSDLDQIPEQLPALEFEKATAGLIPDLTKAGLQVIALRAPAAFMDPDDKNRRVLSGGIPAASFDNGRFLFVRETKAKEPVTTEVPGGRVLATPATARSGDGAIFVFQIEGPRLAPDAPPLLAEIEIRTTRDRMRAEVRSKDDFEPAFAGVFTRPIRVRFEPTKDFSIYARCRVYIRPTGDESLQVYIEPVDFDPILPPAWQQLSSPANFAATLEKAHGTLPRFSGDFPHAALAAGLLDERDAAAALDAEFAAEKAIVSNTLAAGGFRVLLFETRVLDDVRWFDAVASTKPDAIVEFAGRRIKVSHMRDAAAGALDTLLGEVLARIDKRDRRESIALLVAASAPDEKSGVFAMTRLAYDVEPGRPIEDVTATVFALLGVQPGPTMTGKPFPVGNMMERLTESRFDVSPAKETP